MNNHPPARIRKTRVLHPCPQCGKAFTKRSNMLIHARLHTGEKPYVCKYAGCGRAYKWLSSINFHEGRCDKRSAGLAVPAPRPPPPPAAAEAARVAAAAAAAAAAANQPQIPPIHSPAHLQPLPSYQSLQRNTQARGLSPPPPPPPPPLRPPPQFSSQHILSQAPSQPSHHPSFPQAMLPPHTQPQVQPLPFSNHPPAHSPPPPNAQSIPFHQQQQQQQVFHTPPKGKRFRSEMTPLSPVTPQAAALAGPAVMSYPTPPPTIPSMRPLSGLNNINLMKSIQSPCGPKRTISNVSVDQNHLVSNPNLDEDTQIVRNIVGLSAAKRGRSDQDAVVPVRRVNLSTATISTKKHRVSMRHQIPGSPDSATSKEVKEMLAPYVPYSLLGGTLSDIAGTTSETAKAEPLPCQQVARVKMEVKQEAKQESKLEIGDSFRFEDEDFLQHCGMSTVFDDLERDAYGIALEQCSTDSDAVPIFR